MPISLVSFRLWVGRRWVQSVEPNKGQIAIHEYIALPGENDEDKSDPLLSLRYHIFICLVHAGTRR
jgi:hypothetical protein